jgi:hypothetical protein
MDPFLMIAQVLASPEKEKRVKIPVFKRLTPEQVMAYIKTPRPQPKALKHENHLKI